MKLLKLSNGIDYVVVDDEDCDRLSRFTWIINDNKSSIMRHEIIHVKMGDIVCKGRVILVPIANEIMHQYGVIFDHTDRDCKNNQKYNLRQVTNNQNQQNRSKAEGCVSKYKGVTFHEKRKEWRISVTANGKRHYKSGFISEEDAALSYNELARQVQGEFAVLNMVDTINNNQSTN